MKIDVSTTAWWCNDRSWTLDQMVVGLIPSQVTIR